MEKNGDTALRLQLENELKNKKQCSYESYRCSQIALDGYNFCSGHILSDKNAPFKQCNYTYQNSGKRCYLPAIRTDKREYGYCNEHAIKCTIARNKQHAKKPPPLSAEFLLSKLSHYVHKPYNHYNYSSNEKNESQTEPKTTIGLDPFRDIDINAVYSSQCNEVLDMCSESDSDIEPSFPSVWHDANADSSDNESIDSEEEDVLKHANVYTAEEISLLTRDKLVRLQTLYIEQYRYLQYILKEKRRNYIQALKREKETCCNIYNQIRDNPKEQQLYAKLKAFIKYQRSYGNEAILRKRLHDLRTKISDGTGGKLGNYSKCTFTEGGVKCGEKTIPMAKHCRKHILEDPNQVLFKICGKVNGDIECNTPVEAIFDDSVCKLHMEMPVIRSYNQPRTYQGNKCRAKESESDNDDTLDLPPCYMVPKDEDLKSESLDYPLSPELCKMEALPTMLFEDSVDTVESLSPSLQYSTNEFMETFEPSNTPVGTDNDNSMADLNVDNLELPTPNNDLTSNITESDVKDEKLDGPTEQLLTVGNKQLDIFKDADELVNDMLEDAPPSLVDHNDILAVPKDLEQQMDTI